MAALERPEIEIGVSIRFRLATAEDLPKLEWYGQYSHYRNLFHKAYREQGQGKRAMLLADCQNFPVGHIFMQFITPDLSRPREKKRAYLYAFRVMEMFRGNGIGTQLMRHAEELIVDRGFRRAVIAVAKDNRHARRLYERMGYKIFTDDPGQWSYTDHTNQIHTVSEPCWLLRKEFGVG